MEDRDIPKTEVSDWVPETDPLRIAVLGKFGEEAGELCTAIFRCLIQGIDEREPKTGKLNCEWLEDEIADVFALAEHTMERFGLDHTRIGTRVKAKYNYKASWFDSFWLEPKAEVDDTVGEAK